MKQVISTCLTIAALALFQFNALGWGSAGHMVIAAEAFRALSPTQQAQIYDTLKAHPNFAKWTNSYHANGNVDLPSYVFMRSSTWADEIRRTENPYDHPNWHFIDYPIRPPQFPMEPDARPTDNVLYGISQCEKVLGDTNASPELRAVHLAWLVHLIGDLHQPLHCESYFTAEYPEGDKGGNDFFVKPAKSGIRLHGL
ncbi:MAG TPA: S1/P1 nuclease, partial [Verrucomicrobiae bacterium]